jgi:hypothetical protein
MPNSTRLVPPPPVRKIVPGGAAAENLTVRDAAALAALTALLQRADPLSNPRAVVRSAYMFADLVMEERENGP